MARIQGGIILIHIVFHCLIGRSIRTISFLQLLICGTRSRKDAFPIDKILKPLESYVFGKHLSIFNTLIQ